MKQGRFLVVSLIILVLSACSGQKPRAPDCFSCTEQEQSWQGFSWSSLQGSWKGSVETVTNIVTAAKKETKEDAVEVSFLDGKKFLESKGMTTCGAFPLQSVVFMGQLWRERDEMTGLNLATGKVSLPPSRSIASEGAKVYEVFGATEDDQVSYGRATFSQVNGQNFCSYAKVAGKFFKNRLALPALTFSRRVSADGRVIASGTTPEYEVSMEFLDFRPTAAKEAFAEKSARRPSSVFSHDKPQLFLRVFKIARNVDGAYSRGEWTGTQEYLYRLWRQ